jgi:hypothetical protein
MRYKVARKCKKIKKKERGVEWKKGKRQRKRKGEKEKRKQIRAERKCRHTEWGKVKNGDINRER